MPVIRHKDGLHFFREKAAEYMQQIKTTEFSSAEELHLVLHQYVLCKYLLWGGCTDIWTLDELAQLSVAKSVRMTKTDAFKADSKASCEGTTSAMNKKALLLMAIQRELDVKFPVEITADLTDTKLLAAAVYRLLQDKKSRS